MKLKAYIDDVLKISVAEAARQLKKRQQSVHLWYTGERIPRKGEMAGIVNWSNGAVQPNDFYDLTEGARANGHDLKPQAQEAAA